MNESYSTKYILKYRYVSGVYTSSTLFDTRELAEIAAHKFRKRHKKDSHIGYGIEIVILQKQGMREVLSTGSTHMAGLKLRELEEAARQL